VSKEQKKAPQRDWGLSRTVGLEPDKDSKMSNSSEKEYSTEDAGAQEGEPWPEPDASLFGNYGDLPDFPVDLLPGAIRPFIKHLAKTMHSPPEFIAIPALCAAGAMLGRKVRIQMKQVDGGWKERAALWGLSLRHRGV
jgi:hypothetical protein